MPDLGSMVQSAKNKQDKLQNEEREKADIHEEMHAPVLGETLRQGGETIAVTRWMLPCPPATPTPLKRSESLSLLVFQALLKKKC